MGERDGVEIWALGVGDGILLGGGGGDALPELGDAVGLFSNELDAERRAVDDAEESATERYVDGDLARAGGCRSPTRGR